MNAAEFLEERNVSRESQVKTKTHWMELKNIPKSTG